MVQHPGSPPALVRDALPTVQREAGNAVGRQLVETTDAAARRPPGTASPLGCLPVQRQPVQRQPDPSRSEVVVTVRWSADDAEFFRRTVSAIARRRPFAAGGRSRLYQPVHGPAIGFHRALAPRLGSAYRGDIRLTVSGVVTSSAVSDIRLAQVGTAAGQQAPPPTAEQVADGETGQVAMLIRLLGNASKLRRGGADVDIVNRHGELEVIAYQARGEDGPSADAIDWRRTRDSIASSFALVGIASHSTFVYAIRFDSSRGYWDAPRIHRLVEVLPLPEPTAGGGGQGYDETQEIIDDVRSSRRLVLDTAAMLIAEQDPTRWQNLAMMFAPFAVVKLGRFAGVARVNLAANLKRLRLPGVTQMQRGHHMVKTTFDTRLVEIARELRASQAGITVRDFGANNIAVARIRINDEVRYIDAGNVRASVLGASRGLDSEQMLLTQVQELRKTSRVELEQLYSERRPCVTCTGMLDRHEPGAAVYFTVPERFHDSMDGASRGRKLMEAYGVE